MKCTQSEWFKALTWSWWCDLYPDRGTRPAHGSIQRQNAVMIIIILLNNIQNYLLSIHTLYNSSWGWMFARSVYPPIVLTYYERFRNYVATPFTIPVRHHLITSSIPTYCRKRKPVILATATPYFATRFVLPLQNLPY